MKTEIIEFCRHIYNVTYQEEYQYFTEKNQKRVTESQKSNAETAAQKEAIKRAIVEVIRRYPDEEPATLWKIIYATHVHRKSGIDDTEVIEKVISADQSWKKSSGHAFEEVIKYLGNLELSDSGIEIVLQRDLNTMIQDGILGNEPRDISWLKEQINAAIFDLYAVVTNKKNGKKYCYGCIQSKTSIRDRVTRDREPSIAAMQSFFWSSIIVLDGDFLKNKKFVNMVNGGSTEHPTNGWHGMYVFSEKYSIDRIYSTDLSLKNFKKHAAEAAEYWLTQRQWFNNEWRATN
ncbi:BsaWI family type II restriction enzyme [Fibrobacter sp.]|uniref:BsaWI family type II restriction enzyme n=1 Tax=Fibrobacter sp. TaxID=35828 RepID=UPI00387014BF